MEAGHSQITYQDELLRKGIHLSSLTIPIVYLHVEHVTGIVILVCMTSVMFLIDVGRHYNATVKKLLMNTFGSLLRHHELDHGVFRLTGATWVLVAATLTLGVFPTVVGVSAFTILIVSDTLAALIGRRYGEKKFLDKSAVGTSTFAVSSWVVIAIYGIVYSLPWSYWVAGCIGGTIGAVAEASAVRLKLDDNIAIPFSVACSMMLLEWCMRAIGGQSFIYLLK